jgi:hypothetical protein
MLTVVDADGMTPNGALIDEIGREGARRMLAGALEAEVNIYLAQLADQRDEAGRRLVARIVHLRTTNPIESTFSTVRLRTKVSRGAGSRAAALAMTFKLIESAQDRWRAVNAPHLVEERDTAVDA